MEIRKGKCTTQKTVAAIIMLTIILTAIIPIETASAATYASGKWGNGGTWSLSTDGKLTIYGYNQEMPDYDIYKSPWSNYKDQIISIEIHLVPYIGKAAFMDCPNLKEVFINVTTEEIGAYAFAECDSLRVVAFNDSRYGSYNSSLHTIGEYAFASCDTLSYIRLPENIKDIRAFAFYECVNLEKIEFPESCQSVLEGAFLGCEDLKEIYCRAKSISFDNYSFSECYALEKVVSLGEISSIGECAFFDCFLLEKVVVVDGIKKIETRAFQNCSSLSRIHVSSHFNKMGDMSFDGCEIEDVYFTGSEKQWTKNPILSKSDTFAKGAKHYAEETYTVDSGKYEDIQWSFNSAGKLTIKGSGEIICNFWEEELFEYLWLGNSNHFTPWEPFVEKIKTLSIGKGITKIGDRAFWHCENLKTVTLPKTITYIGHDAFYNCYSLKKINLSESLQTIKSNAFLNCESLEQIILPSKLKTIEARAFNNCVKLQSIEIPASVTSIHYSAFDGCYNISEFLVNKNNKKFSSIQGVLFSKGKTKLIIYPEGKTTTKYTIPESTKTIGTEAFSYCYNLKTVIFPKSVTEIKNNIFIGCDSLQNITYKGKKAAWKKITIGSKNTDLKHFVMKAGLKTYYYSDYPGVPSFGVLAWVSDAATSSLNSDPNADIYYYYYEHSDFYNRGTTPDAAAKAYFAALEKAGFTYAGMKKHDYNTSYFYENTSKNIGVVVSVVYQGEVAGVLVGVGYI